MQVSYANDHVTHVVIGGGNTIDFGISNSAEFFNILSSTLYKDQILAVVREVLCNAWDAHIEAGCTDKPVQVTIDNNKLVVKDCGKGIHHDDIGLIYGTYGNSTKKNDGQQTGGFGLGCKSPFAYTDHFEVTSCHAGVRTIYAMAKSSAQVGGKPGITTIAQFPTEETGLTVTINLSTSDVSRFRHLIRRIAHNGDMNVVLNSALVDTINFDVSQSNWMILNGDVELTDATSENIFVRYGNVIYPIDSTHKDIYGLSQFVSKQLQKCVRRSYSNQCAKIVFQAPPHSIAVTPSRESLSMQDHTVKTLVKLMSDFKKQVETSAVQEEAKYLDTQITKLIQDKKYHRLFNEDCVVPFAGDENSSLFGPYRVSTVEQLVARQLCCNYIATAKFRKTDLSKRAKALADANVVPRGLVATYLKELDKAKKFNTYGVNWEDTQWLHRNMLAKLVVKLTNAKLDADSLRVYDNAIGKSYNNTYPVGKYSPRNIYECFPYLENIIVLTTAMMNIRDRVRSLKDSPFKNPHQNQFLLFVISRKKDQADAERAFWKASGMTVVDMTELEEKPVTPAVKEPAKPRLKGIPALSTMAHPITGRISSANVYQYGEKKRVEKPLFIVRNASKYFYHHNLEDFSQDCTNILIKLFGEQAGICNTKVQFNNWRKKFPIATEYLPKVVFDYCAKSQNIKDYFAYARHTADTYLESIKPGNYDILHTIYRTKSLLKMLGYVDKRSEEEKMYSRLLEYIYLNWFLGDTPQLQKDIKELYLPPLNPKLKAFIDKSNKSTLLHLLDMDNVVQAINDAKLKDKALKMYFYALNN